MARPYSDELSKLNETFDWARRFDITLLRRAVLSSGAFPLVAIGSGGSLTAAHFMASAHRHYTRQVEEGGRNIHLQV